MEDNAAAGVAVAGEVVAEVAAGVAEAVAGVVAVAEVVVEEEEAWDMGTETADEQALAWGAESASLDLR